MSLPIHLLLRRSLRPRQLHNAFTLSELLVASALGLIVVSAAGSVLISHIRSTTVQTVQLRFQNDWARVSNLIETEVGEGGEWQRDVVPPLDPPIPPLTVDPAEGCGIGNRLFTITVPVINPASGVFSYRQISYNQSGNDLTRCGPPIRDDGTLDVRDGVAPVDRVLLRNARLTRTNPNDPMMVEYNLTLRLPAPPPGYTANRFDTTFPAAGQFVQARTKANYIDN